jgi:hypothetical protein
VRSDEAQQRMAINQQSMNSNRGAVKFEKCIYDYYYVEEKLDRIEVDKDTMKERDRTNQ